MGILNKIIDSAETRDREIKKGIERWNYLEEKGINFTLDKKQIFKKAVEKQLKINGMHIAKEIIETMPIDTSGNREGNCFNVHTAESLIEYLTDNFGFTPDNRARFFEIDYKDVKYKEITPGKWGYEISFDFKGKEHTLGIIERKQSAEESIFGKPRDITECYFDDEVIGDVLAESTYGERNVLKQALNQCLLEPLAEEWANTNEDIGMLIANMMEHDPIVQYYKIPLKYCEIKPSDKSNNKLYKFKAPEIEVKYEGQLGAHTTISLTEKCPIFYLHDDNIGLFGYKFKEFESIDEIYQQALIKKDGSININPAHWPENERVRIEYDSDPFETKELANHFRLKISDSLKDLGKPFGGYQLVDDKVTDDNRIHITITYKPNPETYKEALKGDRYKCNNILSDIASIKRVLEGF